MEFYDELDGVRSNLVESLRLNEIYEQELRTMARKYRVPMMLMPMYEQQDGGGVSGGDDDSDEIEHLESTRND